MQFGFVGRFVVWKFFPLILVNTLLDGVGKWHGKDQEKSIAVSITV